MEGQQFVEQEVIAQEEIQAPEQQGQVQEEQVNEEQAYGEQVPVTQLNYGFQFSAAPVPLAPFQGGLQLPEPSFAFQQPVFSAPPPFAPVFDFSTAPAVDTQFHFYAEPSSPDDIEDGEYVVAGGVKTRDAGLKKKQKKGIFACC